MADDVIYVLDNGVDTVYTKDAEIAGFFAEDLTDEFITVISEESFLNHDFIVIPADGTDLYSS